jgi:hypothetical protein
MEEGARGNRYFSGAPLARVQLSILRQDVPDAIVPGRCRRHGELGVYLLAYLIVWALGVGRGSACIGESVLNEVDLPVQVSPGIGPYTVGATKWCFRTRVRGDARAGAGGQCIAIDGKAFRHSHDGAKKSALHALNAWSKQDGPVLALWLHSLRRARHSHFPSHHQPDRARRLHAPSLERTHMHAIGRLCERT